MIDTDKYEDELEHRMNKEFCNDIACGDMHKESAVEYAHEFYGNALDLLAEVKRLRSIAWDLYLFYTDMGYDGSLSMIEDRMDWVPDEAFYGGEKE